MTLAAAGVRVTRVGPLTPVSAFLGMKGSTVRESYPTGQTSAIVV